MRRFLILLIFVLSCCFTAGAEARRYALLVGVDYYNNVRDLNSCVKDMKDLKEALIKIGFEENDIFVFTDKEKSIWNTPYKGRIERQIKTILEQTQKGDMVFFAFSGHGARKDKADYFCPQDANLKDIEGTCISIKEVILNLYKCNATFKWMVIDACRDNPPPPPACAPADSFNGHDFELMTKSLNDFQGISESDMKEGIVLFQSCKKGERSYEEKFEGGNGYFVKNFVAALSGLAADANHDGKLMLLEVVQWTMDKTKEEVKTCLNKDQTPYVQGNLTDITLFEDLKFQRAKALAREAREAMDEENYKQARDKFKEALELCPDVVPWQRGLKQAERDLKQSLDSKPKTNVTVPNK